jgi:hypothetical protein
LASPRRTLAYPRTLSHMRMEVASSLWKEGPPRSGRKAHSCWRNPRPKSIAVVPPFHPRHPLRQRPPSSPLPTSTPASDGQRAMQARDPSLPAPPPTMPSPSPHSRPSPHPLDHCIAAPLLTLCIIVPPPLVISTNWMPHRNRQQRRTRPSPKESRGQSPYASTVLDCMSKDSMAKEVAEAQSVLIVHAWSTVLSS